MIDFGYANSWAETPIEVENCRELGHEIEDKTVFRCVTEFRCPICQYKYKIDSGG